MGVKPDAATLAASAVKEDGTLNDAALTVVTWAVNHCSDSTLMTAGRDHPFLPVFAAYPDLVCETDTARLVRLAAGIFRQMPITHPPTATLGEALHYASALILAEDLRAARLEQERVRHIVVSELDETFVVLAPKNGFPRAVHDLCLEYKKTRSTDDLQALYEMLHTPNDACGKWVCVTGGENKDAWPVGEPTFFISLS